MNLTFNEYQAEAIKTVKPGLDHQTKVLYFSGKLAEEVGETIGPLLKNLVHGKPIPQNHVISELGDQMYYIAALAHEYGVSLQEIVDFNIAKIRKRHGESYNACYYKS